MKSHMKFDLKEIKRIVAVFAAVILMGFLLSILIRLNFGTDPCTVMNIAVSDKLGISFGSWQVIFNILLLIIVILFDRSQIGWGTIANMFLIGYSVDFFTWVFDAILPNDAFDSLVIRIIVLIPTLLLFLLAAAVYMAVDLGSAPYDAVPFVLASKLKRIPFRFIRITWDATACLIGFLLGSRAIGVITIAIALAVGPIVSWMKVKIVKFF